MNNSGNEEKLGDRKKLVWSIVFVIIAALSVWAVIAQSKNFSIENFFGFISRANPIYLLLAVLSMFGFIYFEGAAICIIGDALGYKKRKFRDGFLYSASDIYFSAITPSATGGQPASAYFMMREGIPAAVTTATLLINLMMYSGAIVLISLIVFVTNLPMFFKFSLLSKILIALGFLVQAAFCLFFTLLITKEKMLYKLCTGFLKILAKLHLVRKPQAKIKKLEKVMLEYGECTDMIKGHNKQLAKAFFCNFLQRVLQIAVTMFTFFATLPSSTASAIKSWFVQAYSVIGSNCIPIPGAMGATDYLMLDGFTNVLGLSAVDATDLELLSRSLSFYICIIICGITTLLCYFFKKKRGTK